jgi:hypothetical protein
MSTFYLLVYLIVDINGGILNEILDQFWKLDTKNKLVFKIDPKSRLKFLH